MTLVVVVVLPAVAPEVVHSVIRILKVMVVILPGISVDSIVPVARLWSVLLWIDELRSRLALDALVMLLVLVLKLFNVSLTKIGRIEIQPSGIDLWRYYMVVSSLLRLYSLSMCFPVAVILLSKRRDDNCFGLINVVIIVLLAMLPFVILVIFYSMNIWILLIFLIWTLGHF